MFIMRSLVTEKCACQVQHPFEYCKNQVWVDIEALLVAVGCKMIEGDGSRVWDLKRMPKISRLILLKHQPAFLLAVRFKITGI